MSLPEDHPSHGFGVCIRALHSLVHPFHRVGGEEPGCKVITSLDEKGYIGSVTSPLFEVRKTRTSGIALSPF